LYPDTIIRLAPPPKLRPRLYLPFGTPAADAVAARAQNFATINGLAPHPDPRAEALRLGCSHVFSDGKIVPLA
jgi:ATP phosphoribosyltransferase regulatory subunit